ncbi:peptidoglycan-binding protein [Rhodobium gokarnense]|uniref:Peptidoglycan binding-like domain-containing protein n=1 Tax=Rhodobium gokarnense TaxID=364296 RepID=A0ABT3HHZ4_9HYPH|nr:peptidoglycan-binding protein [Rhodobium gokarnense]MCW2310018.1 hypothetical protein [Rhodobium gokarnense]
MTVSATSAETRGFFRLPAAFFALALATLVPSLLATPAAAQRGDVQRCARTCLDDFGSINHPGYRRCVSRRCLGSGPVIRRAPDPVAPPAPVVRQGPDQPQVRSVQRQLTELGYDPGPVDGLYGEQTAETIRQFLADRGIRGNGRITRRLHRELAAARAEQRRGVARQQPRTEPRTEPRAAPRTERARAPITDDLAPTAPAAKPKPPQPKVAEAAPADEPDTADDAADDRAADEDMADMPEDANGADEATAEDAPSDEASAEPAESEAPEATAPRRAKPRDILAEAAEARRKAEEAENAGAENADDGAEQPDAIAETAEASEAPDADEPEAATADVTDDGPRALIADIYTLPDPDVGVWAKNRRLWYFSDHMLELVEAAEAAMKEKNGSEELDFNPIVPGQDYNITDLSISEPKIDGDTATVTVKFTNTLGGDSKTHELVYTLVTLDDSWLIDDIVTDGTALSDTLQDIAGN